MFDVYAEKFPSTPISLFVLLFMSSENSDQSTRPSASAEVDAQMASVLFILHFRHP